MWQKALQLTKMNNPAAKEIVFILFKHSTVNLFSDLKLLYILTPGFGRQWFCCSKLRQNRWKIKRGGDCSE